MQNSVFDHINKFALSAHQENILFWDKLSFDDKWLHNPMVVNIKGRLNLDTLEYSLNLVIKHYPSLRRVFCISDKDTHYQFVDDSFTLQFDKMDLSSVDDINKKLATLDNYIAEDALTPFDLYIQPPLRIKVVVLGSDDHIFLINIHPLVLDSVSLQQLLDQTSCLYNTVTQGKSVLTSMFLPIAQNMQLCHNSEANNVSVKYQELISSLCKVIWGDLRTDFVRPSTSSFIGKAVKCTISKNILTNVQKIIETHNCSRYSFFLSIFHVLLYKYSDYANNILTRVQFRRFDSITADFILPSSINNELQFLDLVQLVHENAALFESQHHLLLKEFFNSHTSFKDDIYNYYPKIMFCFESLKDYGFNINDMNSALLKPSMVVLSNDLRLTVQDNIDTLDLHFHYAVDLFKLTTIENLAKHYQILVESIANDPTKTVGEYDLFNKNDLSVLQYYNNTDACYPNKTLVQLFEEQVVKTPHNVAAISGDHKLSYNELNCEANKMAYYLKAQGVRPKTSVAIYLNRSLEALISFLAILKSGASCIYIDPSNAAERVYYMIQNSAVQVLITHSRITQNPDFALSQHETDSELTVISYDDIFDKLSIYPTTNLPLVSSVEDVAYVIFTSGSTGYPKGVMIEHNSIVNCIFALKQHINLKDNDSGLLLSSLSFDISVIEYFLPWLSGATVVVAEEGTQKNPQSVVHLITRYNITFLQGTPAMWQMLVNCGWVGKNDMIALSAGEALTRTLADEVINRVYEFYNAYGPTETTIYATLAKVRKGTDIVIGKPIANHKIYITDAFFKLVPIGLWGEICISGVGVGRGYLGDVKLGENKFLNDNPFVANDKNKQSYFRRIYKTGDIARYLPNGDIEYLGRIDSQVKIRGYRIEPLEIEVTLLKHYKVNECAVVARLNPDSQQKLIAYIVPKDLSYLHNKQSIHREIINFLKKWLPEYMIPSSFIFLSNLPRNLSGKIDRKVLKSQKIERPPLLTKYSPINTNTQKIIKSIWSEVLQIEDIGINDNFFDLGGYSLLATQVYNLLNKKGFNVSIVDIFQNPTIYLFAQFLDEHKIY